MKMTIEERLQAYRTNNPGRIFTMNTAKTAIGVDHAESSGGFFAVAGLGIDGKWYERQGNIMANGKLSTGDWVQP